MVTLKSTKKVHYMCQMSCQSDELCRMQRGGGVRLTPPPFKCLCNFSCYRVKNAVCQLIDIEKVLFVIFIRTKGTRNISVDKVIEYQENRSLFTKIYGSMQESDNSGQGCCLFPCGDPFPF